jgi:NAD(P)-dependent dehydrogenase (short-subunit alcohol dehydrogenase family)
MGELTGKTTLIVGAASGIGLATAELFAREGAQLILADLDSTRGRSVAARLQGQTRADFFPVDISDTYSGRNAVEKAREDFVRLDCVVNSAGVEGQDALLHEMSEESFDHVVAVNLRGPFLVMKYTIPWLLACGGGSIVNVASAAGMVGATTMAAYCSSKGGLVQLSRVAAIDYAQQGIRVNTVCPGVVDTPMMRRELARRPANVRGLSTLENLDNLVGRVANASEVAEAILFLCGGRAPFIIGTELVIDGGKLTR